MAKVQKDVLLLTFVGFVAIIGLFVLFLHGKDVSLTAISFDEESLIGQAVKAMTACGSSQKAICQQMQNRCTTMKGTWTGDCTACKIACTVSKKKSLSMKNN